MTITVGGGVCINSIFYRIFSKVLVMLVRISSPHEESHMQIYYESTVSGPSNFDQIHHETTDQIHHETPSIHPMHGMNIAFHHNAVAFFSQLPTCTVLTIPH